MSSRVTTPKKVFNLSLKEQIVSRLPSIAFMSSKILAYLKEKKAIVSRLPFKANTINTTVQSKQDNQIVSRETILSVATEGETIYAEATEGETFLTKIWKSMNLSFISSISSKILAYLKEKKGNCFT